MRSVHRIKTRAFWGPKATRFKSTTAVAHCRTQVEEITGYPSLDEFRPFYDAKRPVVMKSALDKSVMKKWNDFDYLLQHVGPDHLCDVEIGAYNRGDKLSITFEQYISYIRLWKDQYADAVDQAPDNFLLYLAQNDLPHNLRNDVEIPNICYSFGEGHIYQTMLWFGPKGVYSPLHYDPLDNILMQVSGRKRILLLPRSSNPSYLYVGQEWGQQYNTSAVDIESPDVDVHPLFKDVPVIFEYELEPGDCIFIPAKWWHFVRSLELSISVNVWWR